MILKNPPMNSPSNPLNPKVEILTCAEDPLYFLDNYTQVFDATTRGWIPFRLWKPQIETLDLLAHERLIIILKARQLGFSWLVLGFALWQMIFRPSATVLIFSKRDDEAVELLDMRLKEMHARLPTWLQVREGKSDGKHDWALANGSRAKAFPTTGGRSYTGSLVIVDEADFVPDLNALLNAVKPTIDAGGQLVLLSTSDKKQPESTFKKIYRGAKAKENTYRSIFYGWRSRPGRSSAWFEAQKKEILSRTGSLDDLQQEYPETDIEALSPRSSDKRVHPLWLQQCFQEQHSLDRSTVPDMPSLPNLEVFVLPVSGRDYVLGADPAEGNPNSDDSAAIVLDSQTGEECASLVGKFDPTVFAGYLAALSNWYNRALMLVERNNHGHAVLLWLRDNGASSQLLGDHDRKDGWNTTSKSKALLWAAAADSFRDEMTILHGFATFAQLASIEGSTLRAPDNMHDDRAIAYALALQARLRISGPCDFVQLKLRADTTLPRHEPPKKINYPDCMRWFAPNNSWQPWLERDGETWWLPDFQTEDMAAYALDFCRGVLKMEKLAFVSEPDLSKGRDGVEQGAEAVRVVIERKIREYLGGRGVSV